MARRYGAFRVIVFFSYVGAKPTSNIVSSLPLAFRPFAVLPWIQLEQTPVFGSLRSQLREARLATECGRMRNILTWLEEGQEIQITMRRRVIARLVPDRPKSTVQARMPDFTASLKKIPTKKTTNP